MSNSNDGERSTAPRDQRPKRPLLIPDPFDGETNFDEWISHSEKVAELNGWTDEEKLSWLKHRYYYKSSIWLKVRLIGKAHVSFNNLAHVVQQSYSTIKIALQNRFEPYSKREMYKVELENRKKAGQIMGILYHSFSARRFLICRWKPENKLR